MPGKAYQSSLKPFENEIIGLRLKRPPTPYSKIAEYLKEKYQIEVRRQCIHKFLKTRAKGYKTCQYAGCIELINDVNQPAIEVPSLHKQAVSEVHETPKQSVAVKPETPTEEPKKIFKMEWSDVYNLTRLSDEEAAERNKRIDEKRKRLEEEQHRKEGQPTPTEPKKVFKMQFSETYNLHRLPPEEAAERRKRIAEKRKRLMEEQLKKENQ